jgi:regulator of protease activity HflC (stomatin/prohibitin superfamily)
MNLLDLLSAFLEPLLDLFPRIARRPASNEWMVVDRWFKGVSIRTSPVLHIPFVTHVEYLPKHEIPIDCGLQRVTSADQYSIAVNATALVQIIDPVVCRDKAAEDYEETVSLIIRSVVCDIVSGHNWMHVQDMMNDGHGFDEISESIERFGIELISFRIEDLQEVFPLSMLQ